MKILLMTMLILLLPSVHATLQAADIYAPTPQTLYGIGSADVITFEHEGTDYRAVVTNIDDGAITIDVSAEGSSTLPQRVTIVQGDGLEQDINRDLQPDVVMKVNAIDQGKASLTLASVAKAPEILPPDPSRDDQLTEEEQQQANEAATKLLQLAPQVTSGLMLIAGKTTLFSAATDYGIQLGIQKLSENDPNVGTAYGAYNAIKGLGQAVSPAQDQPAAQAITGQAFFPSFDDAFILAAFDGRNMYYNFALEPTYSKDTSFLFRAGRMRAKDIVVKKEFSDDAITIDIMPTGFVTLENTLFHNVEGTLELATINGAIHAADLSSQKGSRVDLATEKTPFVVTLGQGAKMSYDALEKKLSVDKAKVEFATTENTIRIKETLITASATQFSVTTSSPDNAQRDTTIGTFEMLLDATLNPFVFVTTKTPFTVEQTVEHLFFTPQEEATIVLEGGKIVADIFTNEGLLVVDTSAKPLVKDADNEVRVTTLTDQLANYGVIKELAPPQVVAAL